MTPWKWSGPIPNISSLTKLESLLLRKNDLDGEWEIHHVLMSMKPWSELWIATEIKLPQFYPCFFVSGFLPGYLGGFESITDIDFSCNKLNGIVLLDSRSLHYVHRTLVILIYKLRNVECFFPRLQVGYQIAFPVSEACSALTSAITRWLVSTSFFRNT